VAHVRAWSTTRASRCGRGQLLGEPSPPGLGTSPRATGRVSSRTIRSVASEGRQWAPYLVGGRDGRTVLRRAQRETCSVLRSGSRRDDLGACTHRRRLASPRLSRAPSASFRRPFILKRRRAVTVAAAAPGRTPARPCTAAASESGGGRRARHRQHASVPIGPLRGARDCGRGNDTTPGAVDRGTSTNDPQSGCAACTLTGPPTTGTQAAGVHGVPRWKKMPAGGRVGHCCVSLTRRPHMQVRPTRDGRLGWRAARR
jgi:hypothetical protein